MQEEKRSIYNSDEVFPWEIIEEEAQKNNMSLSKFIIYTFKLYYTFNRRKKIRYNITQIVLGIILVLQVLNLVISI
jgi:hypothetical protein